MNPILHEKYYYKIKEDSCKHIPMMHIWEIKGYHSIDLTNRSLCTQIKPLEEMESGEHMDSSPGINYFKFPAWRKYVQLNDVLLQKA